MDKKSFLIYLDYEEQFNILTDEQIGQLMRLLIEYEKTQKVPDLNEVDGMVKMTFSFIKMQLDRDREKWEAIKQKRSEAGKRGMEARWGDNKNNKSITRDNKNNKAINEITKITVEDNVEVDVDDNVEVEDITTKELKEKSTDIADDLQEYFIKCTGSTNLVAIQECLSYLDDLPIEVIKIALKKTAGVNGKWNYTKTILDDWLKKEIDTVEKIKAEDAKFKKLKRKPEKRKFSGEQRKYSEKDLEKLYAN